MICARCGTDNSAEYSYCLKCGFPLPDTQQQSTHQLDEMTAVSPPRTIPRADSYSGRTLDGKYRLENKLGEGGMGFVYHATRLHIGDHVAVKVLHGDKRNDPQAGERFRLEAQTAARLKHPNAVGVYDYGVTEDGLRYLVMELVEGRSLRRIISEQGPLPLPAVAEVLSQICAALAEAHRQGIIHRDIKPDNIIVQDTPAGLRVKVLDFGIAKLRDLAASNLTNPGHVMGTPRYMSPEHCMGEELDGRSDIYSLGVVLYEMLCGIVPFTAPTSTAVAVQQVTQPPPSLRRINSFVPPAVEAVVVHALEKKREARPQTATAFAQELSAAIHGRPVMPPTTLTLPAGAVPLVTNPTAPASTSDDQPTTATVPSLSGSREVIPPNFFQSPSQGTNKNDFAKRRLGLVIAIGVLGLLVGAGVVAFLMPSLWNGSGSSTSAPTEIPALRRDEPPANNRSVPVAININTTTATPSPVAESADAALNELSAEVKTAFNDPTKRKAVHGKLAKAQADYTWDYRFTYERAKLAVYGKAHHDEAFAYLYRSAEIAIENGHADAMLQALQSDGGGPFEKLTDHEEWQTIFTALQTKNSEMVRK